jgi:methionine-S-sulfoxide reductase/methionine-R-sulfoxide reductase
MRAWILITFLILLTSCTMQGGTMKNLTDYVTKQCGTEPAFNNAYWNEHRPGVYFDVNTNEALFTSIDKFDSGTGWPSFTKPIDNASIIEKADDSLGVVRTEVRTNASHLGHVFDDGPNGSLRYCINSASLKFVPYTELNDSMQKLFPYQKALLSGGCFWGVQHLLDTVPGVVMTEVGYTGGTSVNPTYEKIDGHAEAVLVVFDPSQINYSTILSYFWRLHDPTQLNEQGPDVGKQYRSSIFYFDEAQRKIAIQSKKDFDDSGVFDVPAVTQIVAAGPFYKAEEYHQEYIDKNPLTFCHAFRAK